jgi:DNA-binding MarR family transcriptional regulator
LNREIAELPPSAKLVFKILQYNGVLTQKQIILESNLPSRTARYALTLLHRKKFVEKRFNFEDARQTLYLIKT